jgi:transposase-like protein
MNCPKCKDEMSEYISIHEQGYYCDDCDVEIHKPKDKWIDVNEF